MRSLGDKSWRTRYVLATGRPLGERPTDFTILLQIAGLEASLAAAQKTIDETPAPAPVEEKDDSELISLQETLASTQAELDQLKSTLPEEDEIAALRDQLTAKETELAGLQERLEGEVEKSQGELDTVREILDNERKSWGEDEDKLKALM